MSGSFLSERLLPTEHTLYQIPVVLQPSLPRLPALGLSCGRWLSPPQALAPLSSWAPGSPSGNPEPFLCGPSGMSGLHHRLPRCNRLPFSARGSGSLGQRSSCCRPGAGPAPHPDLPMSDPLSAGPSLTRPLVWPPCISPASGFCRVRRAVTGCCLVVGG